MSDPVVHEGEALETVLSRIAGEQVEALGVGSWSAKGEPGRRASCVLVCRSAAARVAAYASLTGAGLRFLGSKDLLDEESGRVEFWAWLDGAISVEALIERLEAMTKGSAPGGSSALRVRGSTRRRRESLIPPRSCGPAVAVPTRPAPAGRSAFSGSLAEQADAAALEAASERSAGSIPAGPTSDGESHSLVVHELWVLDDAGSNPASPTDAIARDVPLGDPVAHEAEHTAQESPADPVGHRARAAVKAGVSRRLLPIAGAAELPPQAPAPQSLRGARRARDGLAESTENRTAPGRTRGVPGRARRAAAPRAALFGARVAFRAVDRDARLYREREQERRLRDTRDLDERARVRRYGAAMGHLDEVRDAIAIGEPPDDVRLLYRIAGSFSLLDLGERGSIVESRARKLGALFGEVAGA